MEAKDWPTNMINKITVDTPGWTLFCWNEHVRLFRSILDRGGIRSATPKIARAYNFQKKSLQEMGITESAGRVAAGY